MLGEKSRLKNRLMDLRKRRGAAAFNYLSGVKEKMRSGLFNNLPVSLKFSNLDQSS